MVHGTACPRDSDQDLALELLTAKSVYVHPGHFCEFLSEGNLIKSPITPEQTLADGLSRLLSFL
jgi:hypothetical protein